MFNEIVNSINEEEQDKLVNVIDFCEAKWGYGATLFPVQKFILKSFYRIPLNQRKKSITVWTDWSKEKVRYKLTEQQYLEFLYNEGRCNTNKIDKLRRELVVIAGRGGSKTFLCSFISGYEFYKLLHHGNPQEYYSLVEGARISIKNTAASVRQAYELYAAIRNNISRCRWFDRYIDNITEQFIRFRTDRDIEISGSGCYGSLESLFVGANASGAPGGSSIVVVMDELAHFKDNKGGRSCHAMYQALTPSINRFKNDGRIITISTPLNKSGKLWDLYNLSLGTITGEPSKNILMFQIPSWEMNPNIEPDLLAASYESMGKEAFLCEYGAVFSESIDGWIEDQDRFMFCVKDGKRDTKNILERKDFGEPNKIYYMGVDIGLESDGTGISIVHPERHENVLESDKKMTQDTPRYVDRIILDYSEIYYPGKNKWGNKDPLSLEDISDEIIQLMKRFNIAKIACDQFVAIPFSESLNRRGVSSKQKLEIMKVTAQLNSDVFNLFKTLYLHEFFWMYQDEELLKELFRLQRIKTSGYGIKVQAPQMKGAHDDQFSSLARSIWLCYQNLNKGDKRVTTNNYTPGQTSNSIYNTHSGGYNRQMANKMRRGGIDDKRSGTLFLNKRRRK